MRSFGQLGEVWPQRALDFPYIAADTMTSSGAAFVEIVERARGGEATGLIPLVEHPRRRLLHAISADLLLNTSYDVFLERMHAFAQGSLSLNSTPQTDIEASYHSPVAALSFAHATRCANRVVFRSRYELELAVRLYSYRPSDCTIAALPDPSVPAPVSHTDGDHLAIWIGEGNEWAITLAEKLFSDIPIPLQFAKSAEEGAYVLGSARAIVSFSADPGTAIALARFEKPLAIATPAAAEYLENVTCFEIWDVAAAIDALQRVLAAPAARLRDGIETTLPPARRAIAIPKQPPLVSIIMTVFDRLRHLEVNLERLQRQSYPNIEIIVVSNNGPRADDVCAKFPNVRYIHRAENSGAAGETRNDGIAASRGEYIVALDDDDIFFDDHIATMVEICERGADVVYGDFLIQIVEPRDDGEYLVGYDIEVAIAITAFELLVQNRLGYMAVFARRSVYDSFPIAYDQVRVYGASEVELWLRMAKSFALTKAPRPTSLYTIRKNWKGSVTAAHHFIFADGYQKMYDLYPATGMPAVERRRELHVQGLRAATESPARNARYIATERKV